jgi:hypothetical protein
MTIAILLSKPEFWSALFGALAAFLLGAIATWWSGVNAKRTAGNLAIVTLSQMCSLVENLRRQLLVDAPILAREKSGHDPYSFYILGTYGLPATPPRLTMQDLGFLADSHDPDVLNRLLTAERAFASMLELVRRHEQSHAMLQERLNAVDPTGQRPIQPQDPIQLVGAKFFIDVDVAFEGLQKGLPETRDVILAMGKQLREVLRVQFPIHRFVGFSAVLRGEIADRPPDLPKPELWRRVARYTYDQLFKRRPLWHREPLKTQEAVEPEPIPPPVKRFPPRSWENPMPPTNPPPAG